MGGGVVATELTPYFLSGPHQAGPQICLPVRSGSHVALPAPTPPGSRVKSQGGGEVVLSPSRTPILQGH